MDGKGVGGDMFQPAEKDDEHYYWASRATCFKLFRYLRFPHVARRDIPPDRERYGSMQHARPGAAEESRRLSQVERRCQVEGDASQQKKLAHKRLAHFHHPGLVVEVLLYTHGRQRNESRRGGRKQAAGSIHAWVVRVK